MTKPSATASPRGSSSRITLDLNLGTAHLMDIIEGPAGYGADSILIRYQAPCAIEDQDVEGDNPEYFLTAAAMEDDSMTVKSSSTAGSSSIQQQRQHARVKQRRRRQQRQQLDEQIWWIMASIERFATQFRHLSLRFVGCSFPAEALAWLLDRVDRIECLQMRVTFHGSLGGLAKALQRHPHLTQVFVDHCRPSFDDSSHNYNNRRRKQEDEEFKRLDVSSNKQQQYKQHNAKKSPPPKLASLEPLLDGLAQSKTLRCLTLSHTTIAFTARTFQEEEEEEERPVVAWNAGASLAQFIRMPSLEKLSLEHMTEVQDADLATMAQALKSHHTLKTLSVRQCAVGPLTGQALGDVLPWNRGLQTLDVNIHWWDGLSYEETNEGQYVAKCWETDVISLIQGLQTNPSLKCLGLYCDNLAYTHNAAVVSILGESVEASTNELCASALRELPKIFQKTSDEKVSFTPHRRNCVLEDIIVGHRSFGLTPEIDFYLNWNRAGRSYFCQEDNASPYDWMDAILNHRED
eukprot:Sro211_g087830.1 n/a (518) ;mRNA; f:9738-11291